MSTITRPSFPPPSPPPRTASAAQPPGGPRRFTVGEYHRMIQAGVLTEDDAVELLEGWIIYKMPRNPIHDGTISKIDVKLRSLLPSGWLMRLQSAITTTDSEP